MVTINYQTFGNKGFQLRLRLYQDGETKFINVTKLLKGSIQKRHWNQKKQQFIPSCPFSDENNAMLVQFRQKYDEMAINWTGSVFGMIAAMEEEKSAANEGLSLESFIQSIVDELKNRKHEDGSMKGTYEVYEKLSRRLAEYCKTKRIHYDKFLITEVTPGFVDEYFDWVIRVKNGKGLEYVSKMLHAVLVRAEKAGHINMEAFKNCKWQKKKKSSEHKNRTLTEEQCKQFAELDLAKIPRFTRSALYRDFCLFILYTGQSVCDAATLKYSDIQRIDGVDHFVFRRRKISDKQAVPCCVPINDELKKIMKRWKNRSKDGYVFPIRSNETLKNQITNNGEIKHFIGKCNYWLKYVGEMLKVPFSLHTYTFRHTAITRYISKGVPVIYVANMMGTSVDNCEKIYYNNQGDSASRNKVMGAMGF